MDIPRLSAMNAYWRDTPPVHVTVAWYTEWRKSKASAASDAEFDALMSSTPVKEFKDGR